MTTGDKGVFVGLLPAQSFPGSVAQPCDRCWEPQDILALKGNEWAPVYREGTLRHTESLVESTRGKGSSRLHPGQEGGREPVHGSSRGKALL